MKKTILLTILLCTQLVLATNINEIMYNPEGNDNNREFIEIKGTNNLSDFIIGDSSSNDSLKLLYFQPNSNFSLIVEEEFNYTEISASIFSSGSTIGNNLDNSGDTIYLYLNNTLVDTVSYTDNRANNNNLSLQLIENEWKEGFPTLGAENIKQELKQQECDLSFSVKTDKEIYTDGETVEFWHEISPSPEEFIISYSIMDLFGNFIRDEKHTTNDNPKHFTPKAYGTESVYILSSTLYSCQELNATKNIIVKGIKEKDSVIKIKSLSNNESLMFGDTLWANLNVYKGDTRKSSLYIYLKRDNKKLTETQKFDLDTNYQKYKFSLPLKIPYNCNQEYSNGAYELIVEGLDISSQEEVYIAGIKSTCNGKNKEDKKEEKIPTKLEIISYPENISLGEEFQIKVFLQSNEENEIKLWSYIYSGPTSLSGERESNLQTITIPQNSNITTTMILKAVDFKEDSKLKVKAEFVGEVLKEVTKAVTILQNVEEPELTSNVSSFPAQKQESKPLKEVTGYTIYESKPVKTKELSLYIFGILLILLVIWLVLKNGIVNKNSSRSGRISTKARKSSD